MTREEVSIARNRSIQHVCKIFKVQDIVYLSGPMTGLPDFNVAQFNTIKKTVALTGATVISPADLPQGPAWEHQIRKCMRFVSDCSHMLLIPGWENSKGALLEHLVACQIRTPRFYLDSDLIRASPFTLASTEPAFMTRFMVNNFDENPSALLYKNES